MTKCITITACLLISFSVQAQIGKRFPSKKKVVKDPVSGTMLTFLTSTPSGDSKIYQTHNQWTSDGKWLIFRSGGRKKVHRHHLKQAIQLSALTISMARLRMSF